jgi:hypothetical protein
MQGFLLESEESPGFPLEAGKKGQGLLFEMGKKRFPSAITSVGEVSSRHIVAHVETRV